MTRFFDLQEFDTDGSLEDTAMKEAGGDWVRMTAEKKKRYDKTQFVGDRPGAQVREDEAGFVCQAAPHGGCTEPAGTQEGESPTP